MGWFEDLRKEAEDLLQNPPTPVPPIPVPVPPFIDLTKGKKPEDIAKDAVTAPIRNAKDAARSIGDVKAQFSGNVAKIVEKSVGKDARHVWEDFNRVHSLVDERDAEAFLEGLEAFVKTGKVDNINPIVAFIAAEVKKTRDQYWNDATQIPAPIVDAMPPDMKQTARAARYIDVSDISDLNLPAFALSHLQRARAVVLIDLIFFHGIPDTNTQRAKHLWAHELLHVKQYQELGYQGFVRDYYGEEAGFKTGGNALEIAADLFACRLFPVPNPSYLGGPCEELLKPAVPRSAAAI